MIIVELDLDLELRLIVKLEADGVIKGGGDDEEFCQKMFAWFQHHGAQGATIEKRTGVHSVIHFEDGDDELVTALYLILWGL